MIKKLILNFSLFWVLANSPLSQASSFYNTGFKVPDLMSYAHWPQAMSVKSGVSYDESKDPTLRRGTENWEESQWSFYVVPALFIGVIGLFLFFKKNDE